MSTVIDQIRAVVRKAEDRAQRAFNKKLQAEEERHSKRLDELKAELEAELKVARAALEVLPKQESPAELLQEAEALGKRIGWLPDDRPQANGGSAEAPWDAEDQALAMASRPELEAHVDDEPDMTQVPAALREPYTPRSERKVPRL